MQQIIDSRGLLSIIEFDKVPFEPKRVFIRQNMIPNEIVGNHYHKILEEYICVLTGNCEIILENKITGETTIKNCISGDNIHVPIMTKLRLISKDISTSILVLCSENYDPKDVFSD